MSLNLKQLFPQLNIKQDHFFNDQQLQSMPYFRQISTLIPQKDLSIAIKKCKKQFRLINIKKGTSIIILKVKFYNNKGTIIYTTNMSSNAGYFLCHGAVKLLIKKNNRQKLQSYPKHILHQLQQRVEYLNQQFGIPIQSCQTVMNQFYGEKVMFKYLQYQYIYGQGYFGFSDMIKNSGRIFTVIATQDTVLLELQKIKFQTSLKQLELKKQEFIIKSILQNVTSSTDNMNKPKQESVISNITQQLSVKLSQIYNYFMIRTYDKDQIIYRQGQSLKSIFLIVKGQVQLSKTFKMQIPKKLIKDQNKQQGSKQIQIKVGRLSQKSYIGQIQYFIHIKNRQYTLKSLQKESILIQIQPLLFIKILNQFIAVQKQFIILSKQKYYINNQNYLKQKNKIIKLFYQQFQNIQNKKKQKIINNLLNDEDNQKSLMGQHNQNINFQIFSKEGIFFRDTYEKLQGFQEFQNIQSNNKRAAIRKFKLQTSHYKPFNNDDKQFTQNNKYSSTIFNKDHQNDHFQEFDSKQKLLYSPKKNINILELMISAQVSPVKQHRSSHTSHQSNSKIKRKKSVGKFHQLQKDQAVFKRVLIKNGRFEQDKTTFKANIIKPIVHPKFDDIIKQCMSRKNQIIRRAIGQKKNQFVKDTYQNTIESLKNKSPSISKFSNVTLTCKGTQEFKKKLQIFSKNHRKSDSSSAIRNRVAIEEQNLQACIGFNQPPKSSYQKNRNEQQKQRENKQRFITTISSSNHLAFGQRTSSHFQQTANKTGSSWIGKKNSPQKLVLLNHMMKPMTYSSVQY